MFLNKIFVSSLKCLAIFLFVLYLYSMIISPMIYYELDWQEVLKVWKKWESFNVGVLALIASVIFFLTTKYREDLKRNNELIAAKAFLPDALSELLKYLIECAQYINIALPWCKTRDYDDLFTKVRLPRLPDAHRQTFRDCILCSSAKEGEFLAKILAELQVMYARLHGTEQAFLGEINLLVSQSNLHGHLHDLARLAALINSIFEYARGREPIPDSSLSIKQLTLGLSILEVEPNIKAEMERYFITINKANG